MAADNNKNKKNVRYKYIEHQVLELFRHIEEIDPSLLAFPLDLPKIITYFVNYRLWTYEHFMKVVNVDMETTIRHCNSKTGCSFYNLNENKFVILYNTNMVVGRQRWTLAHEIGHCYLGHFAELNNLIMNEYLKQATEINDSYNVELSKEICFCKFVEFMNNKNYTLPENSLDSKIHLTFFEHEADCFTALFLAPFPLFELLGISSPEDIENRFGLSKLASKNRYTEYLEWKDKHYKTAYCIDMVKLFSKYIKP